MYEQKMPGAAFSITRVRSYVSSSYCAEFIPQIAPMTTLYDPNKTLLHLFTWSNTVTKIVLCSPFFWLLMTINVVLSIVYYTALGNSEVVEFGVDSNGWPWISSFIYGFFGGLVTFMVVIHAGDCYARFVRAPRPQD